MFDYVFLLTDMFAHDRPQLENALYQMCRVLRSLSFNGTGQTPRDIILLVVVDSD